MELTDFKKLMLDKVDECDHWLNGKDIAVAKVATEEENVARAQEALDEAIRVLDEARADVASYTEANITAVNDYKKSLEKELGIYTEPVVDTDDLSTQSI